MTRYFFLFLIASASTASAQQLSMSQRAELRDNCKTDIQQLCAGVKPGGGQVLACVKENQDKLSPQCTETIGKLMAARKN
jgi:hypothetical protein